MCGWFSIKAFFNLKNKKFKKYIEKCNEKHIVIYFNKHAYIREREREREGGGYGRKVK